MIKLSNKLTQNHLLKFDRLAIMLPPYESPCELHIHISHCVSIYPFGTSKFNAQRNKKLFMRLKKNLENSIKKRLDIRQIGLFSQ